MSDAPDVKRARLEEDVHALRAAERRMQRDMLQHRRRESGFVMRLALKERENAELQQQITELRQALHPSRAQTTTLFLDPAVNAEIMRLREEVKEAQRKEKEAQDQLEASQFQSGSIAGKKLIQKCKELQVRATHIRACAPRNSADSLAAKPRAFRDARPRVWPCCPPGGERPAGQGPVRGARAEASR